QHFAILTTPPSLHKAIVIHRCSVVTPENRPPENNSGRNIAAKPIDYGQAALTRRSSGEPGQSFWNARALAWAASRWPDLQRASTFSASASIPKIGRPNRDR